MTPQSPPNDPQKHSSGDLPGVSVAGDPPGQPITTVQPGQVPVMDSSGGVTTATESEYCTFAPQGVSLVHVLFLTFASIIPVYYSLFGKWHS